jgi:hypothetical protein
VFYPSYSSCKAFTLSFLSFLDKSNELETREVQYNKFSITVQLITAIFNQFSGQITYYTVPASQEPQSLLTLEDLVEILEQLAQYEETVA